MEAFRSIHTHSGHSKGRDKCWKKIQETFYTGKVFEHSILDPITDLIYVQVADAGVRRTDLEQFLKDCTVCNSFGRFTNKPSVEAIIYNYPNERWQIDLKDYSHDPQSGNK